MKVMSAVEILQCNYLEEILRTFRIIRVTEGEHSSYMGFSVSGDCISESTSPPGPATGFSPYRSEDAVSKNYCATNSDSPEVELRFFPWRILFKY